MCNLLSPRASEAMQAALEVGEPTQRTYSVSFHLLEFAMLARQHNLIKRIGLWAAVLACLYLGLVLILPPLLEHILGIGVYKKSTGVYLK